MSIIQAIKTELFWLLWVLVIFALIGWYTNFSNYYTPEEQQQYVNNVIDKQTSGFKEATKCLFTVDPNCWREKNEPEEQVQETDRTNYEILFKKPYEYTKTIEKWKESEQFVEYEIASSGDMYLQKFECYAKEVKDENLFHSEDLQNEEMNTKGAKIPKTYKCNFAELQVEENDNEITIIPVLTYTLNTKYTFNLPVLSQEMFFEEKGYNKETYGELIYPDRNTIEYMEDTNNEPTFTSTNDAVTLDISRISNKFPLIYGNSEPEEVPIALSFDGSSTKFGKLETFELIDGGLRHSNLFTINYDGETEFDSSKDKHYVKEIVLVENEGAVGDITSTINKVPIEFSTTGTFKYDKARFKIYIQS